MHLANHADGISSSPVNGNHRFYAELDVFTRPDHAWINRARGLTALSAIQGRLKGEFYERNKSIQRSTQSGVLYLFLEIDERVLQCETVLQHVCMPFNPVVAFGAGAGWNGDAHETS